jgi:hypothetical protein
MGKTGETPNGSQLGRSAVHMDICWVVSVGLARPLRRDNTLIFLVPIPVRVLGSVSQVELNCFAQIISSLGFRIWGLGFRVLRRLFLLIR